MPDWVNGPAIGPEALALMNQNQTNPTGKEIYFDSSAVRGQYERGGLEPDNYVAAEYSPVPAAPSGVDPSMPNELLEALAAGKPPPAHLMPAPTQQPQQQLSPPASQPMHWQAPVSASLPAGAIEMTIPVGDGITARVIFSGRRDSQIAGIHYRKLIRHLEIEAYEEQKPSPRRSAPAIIEQTVPRELDIRTGDDAGQAELPRPPKRRVRKNVGVSGKPGKP